MSERKCDRCGKTFTSMRPTQMKISVLFVDEWVDADLCDECYGELTRWWNDKKIPDPIIKALEIMEKERK